MSLRNTSKTVAAIRKAVVPHPTVKAPWQWGVVDSFTTAPPLTCNIYINGTQNLNNPGFLTKNVRYLESFVPYKGAVVLIGHGTGGLVSDRVIIGDLAGQNIPIHGTITEITSVGGTVTITDPSGPVVNLEVPPAGITQITSTDGTITVTDPTGPITDLAVDFSVGHYCEIVGPAGTISVCTSGTMSLVTPVSPTAIVIGGATCTGTTWTQEVGDWHFLVPGTSSDINCQFAQGSTGWVVGNAFTIQTNAGTVSTAGWTPIVNQIIAGTGISISPVGGTGDVTITATGGGGGYASLTGAGETGTPGDLDQEGGFTVNEAGSTGINLNDSGTGGINLTDTGANGVNLSAPTGGVYLTASGAGGGIYLQGGDTAGGGMFLMDNSTNSIEIVEDNPSTGAIIIHTTSGTNSGGVKITDAGTGGVQVQTNASGLLGFFGVTPVTQPAAPTTLPQVITLLHNLGLTA